MTATYTTEQIADIQRRTLRTLTLGQMVGSAALAASVTVGAFVIQEILGSNTPWGGLATATTTIGAAFMSQVLSRYMTRKGRRPGLRNGYALATVGALLAAAGAERFNLVFFLLGLFMFGSGQAANLLARYTATDLAVPEERGHAMSRIVFASTFGAVFAPLLIGPAEAAGQEWFGLHKYTGPWLLSATVLFLAFCNITLQLRPDPLVVAGGLRAKSDAKLPSITEALTLVVSTTRGRLALSSMVVSQVAMVAVMTMTPVHMKLHGHESISQYVVSLHIAGMYAFSPFVGRFADRKGTVPAVIFGAATLVASGVLSALSGESSGILFPALWLLGIGWNFGLIGGSSMLIESVPAEKRVTVQGSADLMMSFCGGMAGLSSGFIRRAVGYHVLSLMALLLCGVLLAFAVFVQTNESSRRAATV